MNLLMMSMMLLYVDVHVPAATVDGDVVTVFADFAHLESAPLEVVQGVVLDGPDLVASSDGQLPIVWKLSPGTYEITAFGYPDNRLLPNRNKVLLTVVIENPTRQQQIKEAFQKFSIANAEAQAARDEIKTLKPTKAEISAALTP
jgi:hypothetical protein